jgi:hypothetical protein
MSTIDGYLTLEEYAKRVLQRPNWERYTVNYLDEYQRLVEFFGPFPIAPWYRRALARLTVPLGTRLIALGRAMGGDE